MSVHLVAAVSRGRLKECNQKRSLKVFFGLSWLSIDIKLGSEPYRSKSVLEFDFSRKREKSVANS